MSFTDKWAMELQKRLLKNDQFTIIANDCWGAEVYRNFNLAYRTPFVGLFLMAPCYIKLLKNLRFYMDAELTFIKTSKYEERNMDRGEKRNFYPIGLLNKEIEIHFLHYKNDAEALETWNKRKERINWNNLYIKFDSGKDACTYELLCEFALLPYPNKLCISRQDYPEIPVSVNMGSRWVVDGAKMYRISLEEVNMINWLNGGNWKNTGAFYKLFYRLFIKNNKRFL